MGEGKIFVTGYAYKRVTPDLALLDIQMPAGTDDYEKALQLVTPIHENIAAILTQCGFSKSIKQNRVMGFCSCKANLLVETEWHAENINIFIHKFYEKFPDGTIDITPQYSKASELYTELLKRAVEDAHAQALVIAKAAKVHLSSMASITHNSNLSLTLMNPGKGKISISSMPKDFMFLPDTLTFTEKVDVGWSTKPY